MVRAVERTTRGPSPSRRQRVASREHRSPTWKLQCYANHDDVDLVRQLSNPRSLSRHEDIAAVQDDKAAADSSRQRRPRQLQVRLTDDEVDGVVAGYQAGLTLAELATTFGADRRTLAGWLQQRGVSRRGRRLTPTNVEESIRLYYDGWSLAQIADHFGVYPQSIRYQLQKAGVALRPRPGWPPTLA